MDEKAFKRRNWVKNLIIIFLAIMLVLTLFSNTIMNYSLPQVAAQYCYSGSITTRVRGSGTVQAKQTYQVNLPASAKIKDIGIKVGDEVKKGDVMFLLEESETDDLLSAVNTLADLTRQYTEAQAELSPDYTAKLQNIHALQAEISELQAEINNAQSTDSALTKAKTEKKAVDKELKNLTEVQIANLENKIRELNAMEGIHNLDIPAEELNTYEKLLDSAKTDLNLAQAAHSAAQKARDKAQKALDNAQQNQGGITHESILAQERAIEKMEITYSRTLEEYNQKYNDLNAELADFYAETVNPAYWNWINASDDQKFTYQKEYDAAVESYAQMKDNCDQQLKSLRHSLEDQELDLRNAKEDLDADRKRYEASSSDELEMLELALEQAAESLAIAEEAKENAQIKYDDALLAYSAAELNTLRGELELLEKRAEELQEKQEALAEKINELTPSTGVSEAEKLIQSKRNELTLAQNELNQLKTADSAQSEIIQMKLDVLADKIAAQEEKIAALTGETEGRQLTAPVDGIIIDVKAALGDSLAMGDTVAEIQLVDEGCSLTFTLGTEQARRLRVGDEAKITNYWYGNDISARIESITADKNNPRDSKQVVLNIQGNVDVGTNLTFTIGEQSLSYDMVIPNSALREDNDGKFVLTVQSSSTPLGTRYTAVRVDVNVLASDDINTAVSGLDYGQYVVTTASKPINSGDLVRLNES